MKQDVRDGRVSGEWLVELIVSLQQELQAARQGLDEARRELEDSRRRIAELEQKVAASG